MKIEVVVYNIESALQAQMGGADRVELCDNPGEGGTTPSYGTIEVARNNLMLDIFVMIRPRGGDFYYSSNEFNCVERDIAQCKRLGVNGVVFGILKEDGTIDKERCKEFIEKARPLKVTCHRAFDMTRDLFEALEDCIEVGFDRILTSGGYGKALEGVTVIEKLVERAGERISIMAGSGVNEKVVQEIVQKTKVKEIHFSAKKLVAGKMIYKNDKIASMGSGTDSEYILQTVDPMEIQRIRMLAEEGQLLSE